jgi:alkyldihydroxyacetonephosphate synthase
MTKPVIYPIKKHNSILQYLFQSYCKLLFTFYTPVKITGLEHLPQGAFILCSNHCSHLDTTLLMYASGKSFREMAALAAVDYWHNSSPSKRLLQKLLNLIPIARCANYSKKLSFKHTVALCQAFLTRGKGLIIYPEGTRSKTGELQPFKKGALILATSLQLPIVPVYISGSFKAWPKGKKLIRPNKIQVKFAKAIDIKAIVAADGYQDDLSLPKHLLDPIIKLLQERIMQAAHTLTRQPVSVPAKKDHGWGYSDSQFIVHPDRTVELTGDRYSIAGYKMPYLIPLLEQEFDLRLDLDDLQQPTGNQQVAEPKVNAEFLAALSAQFKPEKFSFEPKIRLIHSHGQTTSTEVFKVLYQRLDRVVDMVFFCASESEAATLIALANQHNVCLIPYGGGTSVSSALELPKQEQRMIVAVNMQGLNQIEWLDKENNRACVQAGIMGSALEQQLSEQGYTLGHEPDSIEFSTLGGWIATHASGMKKNRYGNIEDIVENVSLLTPCGQLEHTDSFPRVAMGIEPRRLVLGSEGNLGLITKAVIKIHPKPACKEYLAILFPSFVLGLHFLQKVYATGALPASVRLVDNTQFRIAAALKPRHSWSKKLMQKVQLFILTRIKKIALDQATIATITFEGSAQQVKQQKKTINTLAKQQGGIAIGANNGRQGYQLTFGIAYLRDFLFQLHIMGETFETSTPWNKIQPVCEAVQQTIHDYYLAHQLPAKPLLTYRVTQVYHTGVCIYFTLAVYTKGMTNPQEILHELEAACRVAVLANGGSISHHHGVGKLRKPYINDTLTPCAVKALQAIKTAIDPNNIFAIGNNVFD